MVDQLAPWRDRIPGQIRKGGVKAEYWKLALKLGRLPTLSEEKGWGDGRWGGDDD